MKTLIMPCAGRSSRFPNMRPKWMLYYPDGKMMIEKAMEGICIEEFDQIIIVIVKEHAQLHEADKILEEIFHFSQSDKYKLYILEDYTSSQAETVYRALTENHVEGSFAVKDSDNYIKLDKRLLEYEDFVAGININEFSKEIYRLNAKSFLILNEQSIITDIIEKKIKSEYICIGMYGFSDAERFKYAYRQLTKINKDGYEIYISHIISYLIGSKKSIYKYIQAQDYEDWGTLKDWNAVLKEKATYLVNLDGVLCEKTERYGEKGWRADLRPIEENILTIKKLYDNGAQIIIMTVRDEQSEDKIKELLMGYGIESFRLILNCFHSQQTILNSLSNEIPYPACEAINIHKQARISEYL